MQGEGENNEHTNSVVVVVGSLRTSSTSSIKDYCSPVFCLGAKQRTTNSPSLVAIYDTPGKIWASSIFFVPVLALETYLVRTIDFKAMKNANI